jgi:hypothetical protein
MPQCESYLGIVSRLLTENWPAAPALKIVKLYKTVEKRTPMRLTSQAGAVLDGRRHGQG